MKVYAIVLEVHYGESEIVAIFDNEEAAKELHSALEEENKPHAYMMGYTIYTHDLLTFVEDWKANADL